jgi:hypothetical protein
LQAKIHLLREETSRAADDGSGSGGGSAEARRAQLIAQYDSVGDDLRSLVREWESGKASISGALSAHRDSRAGTSASAAASGAGAAGGDEQHARRMSHISADDLRSPTLSLDGSTAIGSGTSDGGSGTTVNDDTPRSSVDLSSALAAERPPNSAEEEVFEAIAAPHRRISLTREERIAKVREERVRAALARERAQASTNMLRELESVINLRSRPGAGVGAAAPATAATAASVGGGSRKPHIRVTSI